MWKWSSKFSKETDCPKFEKDDLKNPVTNRTIKKGGVVQKWFKKNCRPEGSSKRRSGGSVNFSDFVRSQKSLSLDKLIDKVIEYQDGKFVKDLVIAFTRGYKGAMKNELQEVIIDLGYKKFRISRTGPISKKLQNLANNQIDSNDVEGADVSQKNFCSTKNIKALPKKRKFEAQPHQVKAVKFMEAPDARLLLEHGLGSGKTCSSAMVIDSYLRSNPNNLVHFFSPGNLRSNFISEYCSFCPVDRRIDPQNDDYKNFRFYSLDDGTLKKKLPRRFDNCLVVVDEAQSLIGALKSGENPPTHDEMNDSMQGVKNLPVLFNRLVNDFGRMKLLMLSGTPMPDTLDQHYNCLRLLKPNVMDKISYESFLGMFTLDESNRYVPVPEREEFIGDLYSNCISYYKTNQNDVARVYNTVEEVVLEPEDPLADIISSAIEFEDKMRVIPLESMVKSYMKGGMSRLKASQLALFVKSRAARRSKTCGLSNIIYPDILENHQNQEEDELEEEEKIVENQEEAKTSDDLLLEEFKGNMDLFFETFCPKLGRLIKNIEDEEMCPGKQIIYCPFKIRHGVNIISKILTSRGISNVVYSGDVSQPVREKILREYNDESNDTGEKTKVFLFTDAAAEGISLLSIRGVHLVNEDIYASHMRQVIGRAVRYLSHSRLPEDDRDVTVFRYRLVVNGISSDQENENAGINREQKIKYLERKIHTTWTI